MVSGDSGPCVALLELRWLKPQNLEPGFGALAFQCFRSFLPFIKSSFAPGHQPALVSSVTKLLDLELHTADDKNPAFPIIRNIP